jgi:hypothetical protein
MSRGRQIKRGPQKHDHTPVRLHITEGPVIEAPALVFKRRFPNVTWVVPPVKTPLYWFDILMVRRRLIVAIPPDTFIVDGRRFKVLAQDHKVIGVGYTRWLVFEEAAVPKGEKP